MLVSTPDRAGAQDFGFYGYDSPRPRKRIDVRRPAHSRAAREAVDDAGPEKKRKRGEGDAKVVGAKNATGPLFVVISIADQHISVYNSEGLVTRSVISTGMAGHPTPKGIFSIIGRERYHHSNIYSGAPMPFMQRVTWSGVAMHLGVVPGYPASHGCIRLPARFAQELWGLTKIGERVVISPRDVKPVEFSHALLPVPRMQPAPAPVAETGSIGTATIVSEPARDGAVTKVAAADGGTEAVAAPASAATPKLLNPIEYAALLKAKAAADSAAAAKAVEDTFEVASAKAAEARRAVAELKAAEAAMAGADAKVAATAEALAAAAPEAIDGAEIAKINADAEFSIAARRLDQARAVEAVKTPESFDAVRLWKEARAAVGIASAAAKEAAQRASAVSVLVSKKDQRVYVRQGLAPVLDASATVRDPDTPLGTHVYIAAAVEGDGASLKWAAISMPSTGASGEQASARSKKKSSREEKAREPEAPRRPASSAAEALERIEIPNDVSERISEL
ncbi:MAG TPA: L,D-transpeptidase family protein, partial [Hyphomicrobiaceae bacterium]|nr:L,D-transpeptidase family protein [Hyphomicrobiaceae bacterium]